MNGNETAPGQTDLEPIVSLEGVVDRIVYENSDTGFVVARLNEPGKVDPTTFVGNLLALSPGETVRLRGRWVDDKRFGRQLRVESIETLLPTSLEGIRRYLGSGLIPGIGPIYAQRLVEAFGVETLRVIDEQPERLRRVPGIGQKRAAQIREGWKSQRAIQSIMIFLQGHGIGTGQAVRIYKHYGDRAVAVLRENPYRLAEDISGIGFASADKIAASLGIAKDAPQRIEAGLRHALGQATGEGHVFLPERELMERTAALLDVPGDALNTPLMNLIAREQLSREGERVFLQGLRSAELGCAQLLKRLIATPHDTIPIRSMDNALHWVETTENMVLSPEQREAIVKAIESKVMVITGGPGTGKTTVINSLLAILERKAVSHQLAAPTGRAAKRMEAATRRPARTIHRLLEFSPKQGGFARNEGNPLTADLFVIDESSMIDIMLMNALLKALPPYAKLVLVGDVDQLPSVGPGSVLLDIIASNAVPVVRLKTVFRQAAQSGIIMNAHRIDTGEFPKFNDSDFVLVKRSNPAEVVETVVELVTRRIPNRFGLDPVRQIQVLAPMHRGDAGVAKLNEALHAALNPDGEEIPRRGLRVGDKVMQTRNNYELDVFNGDVGVITLADAKAGEAEVRFDDERRVIYPLDQLDELALAYAASVHKSQGSEYAAVVLVLLPQHYMMLQRNVLYTAVTRGKQVVVIVGEPKAIALAVRNSTIARRNTCLSDRLANRI